MIPVTLTTLAVVLGMLAPLSGTAAASSGQNEEMKYKLRAARADNAHADLVEWASDLSRVSSNLASRLANRSAMDSESRKSLDRVRQLAKKIRGALGGGGDLKLEDPPSTPHDAAAAIDSRAAELCTEIGQSSRFEVNARLIVLANQVMALSDLLKQMGRR